MTSFSYAAYAAPIWSYDGASNGQDSWGELGADYALCENGQQQSPINLAGAKPAALPDLPISYPALTSMHLTTTGHGLSLVPDTKISLAIEGDIYILEEISLHTPSEHELPGRRTWLEIEFMHHTAKGKILILSSLAEQGRALTALQPIIKRISATDLATPITLNIADLLPRQKDYYAYSGSLTTPPCTENVEWRILKQPLSISPEQLQILSTITKRNARLVQPIYFRPITVSK